MLLADMCLVLLGLLFYGFRFSKTLYSRQQKANNW